MSTLHWIAACAALGVIAAGCSTDSNGSGGTAGATAMPCPDGTIMSGDSCLPLNAMAAGAIAGTTGGTGTMAAGTTGGTSVVAAGTTGGTDMMAAGTTGGTDMMAAGTTGGTDMMAGTTGGAGPGMGSTGCGAADHPPDGDQTMDVDGTERAFIVAIPDDYNPNTQYKLVFAWHGLGGTAAQIASGFGRGGYYGLESMAAGSTIFVAGQGLDTTNQVGSGPGWDNMGGRDVAFTRKMIEWLKASYCIDETRIFSVGMSYGGIMSNTVGCQLGDQFRAIAPMSGTGPSSFFGGAMCVDQVAAWISHGNMDNIVQFSGGEGSRDHWVEANHCDTTPGAPDGNGCVEYPGCDDGYPVVWCEFDGGHTPPTFSSTEIWKFFSRF